MQGKVEICGVNTAHLKTLKNDEMVELLRRSQAGDQAARERLIEGNLRLVLSVIQRFLGRGENPDDLFQVGCVGAAAGGPMKYDFITVLDRTGADSIAANIDPWGVSPVPSFPASPSPSSRPLRTA